MKHFVKLECFGFYPLLLPIHRALWRQWDLHTVSILLSLQALWYISTHCSCHIAHCTPLSWPCVCSCGFSIVANRGYSQWLAIHSLGFQMYSYIDWKCPQTVTTCIIVKMSLPSENEFTQWKWNAKLDSDISTLTARHWHGVRSIRRKRRSYASACLTITL